ncbi:MAG: GrpB family protein [Methanomassiliicoccales archaeon]|nr:GrpB family protein [Methanomassiliicoccales archaeon]NYT15598.1 GrpB family protein [Methanomassiliicoccales archaeon]
MSLDDPRDVVEVVEYDPRWRDLFNEERKLLERALSGLIIAIQHVGSTSIPGMSAKPVIDIMICVKEQSSPYVYIERVGPLGYIYQEQEDEPERIYFMKGMPRTHHLHFILHDTKQYWEHILFRDYLIANRDAFEEYVDLKRELAKRFREDREGYWAGKDKFIKSIVEKARRSQDGR